jgi:hypothetical protein
VLMSPLSVSGDERLVSSAAAVSTRESSALPRGCSSDLTDTSRCRMRCGSIADALIGMTSLVVVKEARLASRCVEYGCAASASALVASAARPMPMVAIATRRRRVCAMRRLLIVARVSASVCVCSSVDACVGRSACGGVGAELGSTSPRVSE